jgi:hypothetical protein
MLSSFAKLQPTYSAFCGRTQQLLENLSLAALDKERKTKQDRLGVRQIVLVATYRIRIRQRIQFRKQVEPGRHLSSLVLTSTST